MEFANWVKKLTDEELELLKDYVLFESRRRSTIKAMFIENKRKTGLSVMDFIYHANLSVRLRNVLKKACENGLYYTLDDITDKNFLLLPNAGLKSWAEFLTLVSDVLKERKFDQYREPLVRHFRKVGKGTFCFSNKEMQKIRLNEKRMNKAMENKLQKRKEKE